MISFSFESTKFNNGGSNDPSLKNKSSQSNNNTTSSAVNGTTFQREKKTIKPVRFRAVHESDKDDIKKLHEEWFPVRYNQDFYDSMVISSQNNKSACPSNTSTSSSVTNAPVVATPSQPKMFSIVAVIDNDNKESSPAVLENIQLFYPTNSTNADRGKVSQTEEEEEEEQDLESGYYKSNEQRGADQKEQQALLLPQKEDRIIGCVVGSFLHISKCPKYIQQLIARHNNDRNQLKKNSEQVFYIMTLGSQHTLRNQGLGRTLIQYCIDVASAKDQKCGIVYLHVITYNVSAIAFYEKLGFRRITEIKDYYVINGINYNCYLYAKFISKASNEDGMLKLQPEFSVLGFLQKIICSIWNVIASPFSSFLSIES